MNLLLSAFAASALLSINHSNLISQADLHYPHPVERSEDGMPIGNGRTGTLIWTTPNAIRLQINRVDIFASGSATDSFPERNTDYCGGAGFVDIDFPGYGDSVFTYEHGEQHLSCYDGIATLTGRRVTARALAWHRRDVIAIEIDDARDNPGTIHINLRMLRAPQVRTGSHVARSRFQPRDSTMILTQDFTEADYYCGSAVAVKVIGRDAELRTANERESRLVVSPGNRRFTVLISSAAGFDPEMNKADAAAAQLEAAATEGFDRIADDNREWWRQFWQRSFIHMRSDDGVADRVAQHYAYYLYIMASSSRGSFPTKFNGMLWNTEGDRRQWGALFWGANQSCIYNNTLLAAAQPELLDPHFDMISGMINACSRAAEQQWGSKGLFIPETVAFDGLAPLPPSIAAEMRDLYLMRKPWAERSPEFLEFARTKQPHSSRWNWMGGGRWTNGRWIPQERGNGSFGPVTHIFSRASKYAYQYWVRYEYTGDEQWLRDRAYPLLKGVAEFYRNFPNVKKGPDGRYHIHHVNSNESIMGAQDTDEEIASMMGILPVLIRASEILNVDAEMRPVWKDFLANLAPLPRSDHPSALPSTTATNREPVWIRGLPPVVMARGNLSGRPDGNTMPAWFFDLCTLESSPEILKIGHATFNTYAPPGALGGRRAGVLSKVPLVAAIMGRADAVKQLVPAQFFSAEVPVLANRMDLREGPQTTSAQRLGNAADALHTALCYDLPPAPAEHPVIRVFAAWPEDWDASFTLLARGGFLVSSTMRAGEISFVELQSRLGGECRLRNPWGDGDVRLHRNGRPAETLRGSLLRFDTRQGESVVVTRPGTDAASLKQSIP